jgi:hypothetical protein
LSALGVALCLGLVAFGLVRVKRRGTPPVAAVPVDDPELVWPRLNPPSPRPNDAGVVPLGRAAVLAASMGVFVFLNVPFAGLYPLLGPAVGLVTFLVYRWAHGRGWLGVAGAGCLAIAAAYIVSGQIRHDYISDFTWPLQFTRVHVLGLLAVFLLLAEAVRGVAAEPPDTPRHPGPP